MCGGTCCVFCGVLFVVVWACAVCYRGDTDSAEQAARARRGDAFVCVGRWITMPLSVGHWRSLPDVLHTGNTATTHKHTHTHKDIYTCAGCGDFTTSPCAALTKGNKTLLRDSVPTTRTITHRHTRECRACRLSPLDPTRFAFLFQRGY